MKMVSIEDVCVVVTDGTHYTPPDVGEGVPFLTVKDMSKQGLDFTGCSYITLDEYIKADLGNSSPKVGDILFSKDGTVGKVHVVSDNQEFAVLSSIAILRPRLEVLDSQYFGHILRSPFTLDQAIRRKTGSAIRRIILQDLKQVQIPLPPLEEQRRIATILDKADAVLRKRQQAIALTEELLRSAFLEMFAGDQYPIATVGYLLEKGILLLHKDGNHGSNYPRASDFGTEGVPFLSANCFTDAGTLIPENVKLLSEAKARKLRIGWLERGDVLLAHNATVGRVALYDGFFNEALISTSLTIYRPNQERLLPEFVWGALRSKFFQQQLNQNMEQSTRNQVPITAQRELCLKIPDFEEQCRFKDLFHRSMAFAVKNVEIAQQAKDLFNSLLQKAFRGEL